MRGNQICRIDLALIIGYIGGECNRALRGNLRSDAVIQFEFKNGVVTATPLAGERFAPEKFTGWVNEFGPQQQQQILLARQYAENPCGIPGHGYLLLIAEMSRMLDTQGQMLKDLLELLELKQEVEQLAKPEPPYVQVPRRSIVESAAKYDIPHCGDAKCPICYKSELPYWGSPS